MGDTHFLFVRVPTVSRFLSPNGAVGRVQPGADLFPGLSDTLCREHYGGQSRRLGRQLLRDHGEREHRDGGDAGHVQCLTRCARRPRVDARLT